MNKAALNILALSESPSLTLCELCDAKIVKVLLRNDVWETPVNVTILTIAYKRAING